jgi:Glyoxalase superfamily protein
MQAPVSTVRSPQTETQDADPTPQDHGPDPARGAGRARAVDQHSTALEIVARQLGHADWNVLSAQPATPSAAIPTPAGGGPLPEGWHVSGRSDLFRAGLLTQGGPDGEAALSIDSLAPADPDAQVAGSGEFLTVMQRISAAPWRGRMVSFRARLRCEQATGSGRLWIHARNGAREALASDNLGLEATANGPITGTTGWTERHVTIEVPETASYLGFGVLYGSGTGRFRAAGLSFGQAEGDERPRALPNEPRNLELRTA